MLKIFDKIGPIFFHIPIGIAILNYSFLALKCD